MEELKNIAPHLSQLTKKDAFAAPEGYFDELPSMIQDRIIANSRTKSRFLSPVWSLGTLGIAAVCVVVFFIGKSPEVNEVSKQEVAAYVNDNIEMEFDETLLAEELATSKNEFSASEASLEDYILNQDIDENLLREEI